MQEGDSQFIDLKKMVKKPLWKARTAALWISYSTWRLADHRTALGQTHTTNQQEQRTVTRWFQPALREERIFSVRKTGKEILSLVTMTRYEELRSRYRGSTEKTRVTNLAPSERSWNTPQP